MKTICRGSGYWPLPKLRSTDRLSATCEKCGELVRLSKSCHLLAHAVPAAGAKEDVK